MTDHDGGADDAHWNSEAVKLLELIDLWKGNPKQQHYLVREVLKATAAFAETDASRCRPVGHAFVVCPTPHMLCAGIRKRTECHAPDCGLPESAEVHKC